MIDETSESGARSTSGADCSEALLRVYEFLDGELGPDECAKIQAHLDECGPCLKEYDLDTTLKALVKRVASIFQPARLSLTLFISAEDNETAQGESSVELAQKAFKAALAETPSFTESSEGKKYRRTDKINYEFGGYDLAFASFELK